MEENKENILEAEIESLKAEVLKQKNEYESTIKQLKLQSAAADRLYGEGAKNPKLLLRLLDISEADIDDKGCIAGIDGQIAALKENEPYLFEWGKGGSLGCFRPEEAEDFSVSAEAEASQMTYSQMIKALGR